MVTLNLKELCFDWLFPAFVACLAYFAVLRPSAYTNEASEFVGQVLTVLGVLFGFSTASMTLLITSSSENITRLQNFIAENRIISGVPISAYQLTIITFTFLLILEIFGILSNFAYLLTSSLNSSVRASTWRLFYAFDCFLLMQIFALNIRNTTNIYFVFLASRPKRNPRI
ncbi:MAG TPA: hypothetical protein V6D06_14850 [Trichocoleus sp.]